MQEANRDRSKLLADSTSSLPSTSPSVASTPAQTPPPNTDSMSVAVVAGILRKWGSPSRNPQVLPVRYLSLTLAWRRTHSTKHPTPYQLQKHEYSAPDTLEFERLKNNLNHSYVPRSLCPSLYTTYATTNTFTPIQYRSRLRLFLPRHSWDHPLSRSRIGRDKPNRDEIPEGRSRMDVSLARSGGANVDD